MLNAHKRTSKKQHTLSSTYSNTDASVTLKQHYCLNSHNHNPSIVNNDLYSQINIYIKTMQQVILGYSKYIKQQTLVLHVSIVHVGYRDNDEIELLIQQTIQQDNG